MREGGDSMNPTTADNGPSFSSRVLACVAAIPPGRVMSYGGVGRWAGSGAARAVGQVLARSGDEVPWHRVVRADGTLADHLRARQYRLLLGEGIPMDGQRVVMEWAEWEGPATYSGRRDQ
jgi:methylated-DNA-protein-cysteine methyltransferase related protein